MGTDTDVHVRPYKEVLHDDIEAAWRSRFG
ncbi:hypothetical protein HMPREF1527_01435 [Atopobium sp. oral taxon 199 str. F0494]|nr:hypothetical protein HMPREF1527_01435 [Atopobium sp. oral taxon 199 str. F0494]